MDFILNISLYCLVGKFQINVFWTNVRVNGFIELSLMADVKLKNNVCYWYVDCSVGRLSFVNDAKLRGKSIEITGSTVGVYLSTGVDFLLTDNIALGLMNGSVDEMDVGGKKLELDEPESSLTIDGLIGLKIYL